MSLSKEINGDVNGAVVKSYSRGKTKLDNVFRKKGKLTRFQCSINAENKKNHPFKEQKDKTQINKSKDNHGQITISKIFYFTKEG